MKTVLRSLGLILLLATTHAVAAPRRPSKAPAQSTVDKRSTDLRAALADAARTRFHVLIRFTHPVRQADADALGIHAATGSDLATGFITRDELALIVARVDVMSVSLISQPRATHASQRDP